MPMIKPPQYQAGDLVFVSSPIWSGRGTIVKIDEDNCTLKPVDGADLRSVYTYQILHLVGKSHNMGLGCKSGYTKGRCHKCNICWYWPGGGMKVKDARCSKCGGELRRTAHYLRSAEWRPLNVH